MIPTLQQALERRGYSSLTPVQEAVSDPDLAGVDLLVSAQTGSGKTVGFGLAIAPTILGEDGRFERAGTPLALVIAPTRELALQVKRELTWLYGDAGAVLASCVGGMDMRDERRSLERGAHIVVATPGRLRDHITRGSIDLSGVAAVVLDEADEMLDLGFREDLEFILQETPSERQTLLFSATVSKPIATLAQTYQNDAQRISTINKSEQHSDISYLSHVVAPHDVENAIINVLRFHEAPNAIVFANTRAAVNRLLTRLSNRGFQVVALSGELSQAERAGALQAMRDGRARICVATDVAARGIDLPNLDLVVHADLPSSHETLLHRSGRTGRAGRKGVSALMVTPRSVRKAERLLRDAKLSAEWVDAPSADDVRGRDLDRMISDPSWSEAAPESQAETLAKLVESFSAEQLAAGYLRLWSAARSAPEELTDVGAMDARKKKEDRAPFGPSVWFSIAGGRDAGADPRRLLPMLCKAGGIDKSAIGAIRITDKQSYAEIAQDKVEGFMATLAGEMALDDGSALERLNEAPNLPQRSKPPFRKGGGDRGDRGERGSYDRKPAGDRGGYERKGGAGRRDDRGDSKGEYKGERKPRWDRDESAEPAIKPRAAKPRPSGERPAYDKPRGDKPKFDKPRGDKKFDKPRADKPKGPPPPKGKPNSKKNKARASGPASDTSKRFTPPKKKG
ncbi:DEAD/DEAH box helicase [Phaeobacter sp. HF9A]|uniref:DEAD/DEAH box helicase n=1 Tax=Phaeobacter sp. HF9A TaxID=2721561 RepID=UPI00142FBF14|nr:DEAD/DEAH box helicase [Phaeobacter sp. HF9A]NIZ14370.1 DEAD/DEAH box helicase [Phaeobacter sp. HF9A]